MRVASFNINGIKARLPALLAWLEETKPDVAVLQELKSMDEVFPREPIEELGYHLETHGQKSFNGVAILSRYPLEDVRRGLPNLPGEAGEDAQARYIEGTVIAPRGALRICGLYLPNGNPCPGPKFDYKLAWMARLEARLRALLAEEEPFLLAGDFNIIPQAEDCYDEKAWEGDALYHPLSRAAFQRMMHLGLTDALRAVDPTPETYTFWDYQAGAWPKNHGIRIDHLLLSPAAADLMERCEIDRFMRAREKPSDHVPIWVEFALE